MAALNLGLLVLAAVLVSAVIDQIVPRVSLPLIQIGLGLLIALAAESTIEIDIDPNLFIVLFIVPLIYYESKNLDKAAMWKFRRPVISLVVGLVIVAAVITAYFVNWLMPAIPFAAALALGAALGPTDAVAVTALAQDTNIDKRQKSVLEIESLLNDASGIVAFQFAIAAAATGALSLLDASASFVASFFGGILVGAITGYLAKIIARRIRAGGLDNTVFHVLFELFSPFIVYIIANSINVSGILAVVTAGIIGIISPSTMDPQTARLNIVSKSVWDTVSFALNGVVFVLLGAQLPSQMLGAWENAAISNLNLFGYVLAITAILAVVRFIWVAIFNSFEARRRQEKQTLGKMDIRSLLVMTFAGARGAITLSLVMTIPYLLDDGNSFPQRDTIIFLASGVIIVTLLLATFLVPLIAPKSKQSSSTQVNDEEAEAIIDIYRAVIEELTTQQTRDNRRATQKVIHSYNTRIANIKEKHDIEVETNKDLRIRALRWEQERTLQLIDEENVDPMIAYQYLSRLEHIQNLLKHKKGDRWLRLQALHRIRPLTRSFLQRLKRSFSRKKAGDDPSKEIDETRKLQAVTGEYAIEMLRREITNPDEPSEEVSALILEYQESLNALHTSRLSLTAMTRVNLALAEMERLGLKYELDQIQNMYDSGRISRQTAKRLRENVHLIQIDIEDRI